MTQTLSPGVSRRDAIERLALGAAALALPVGAGAQAPTFPRGAIIRTLTRDYPPDEFAGGATLFHEHVSVGTDFNAKFAAATAAARESHGLPPAAPRGGGPAPGTRGGGAPPTPPPDPMRNVDLMAEELATAKREGVACMVDAGHRDMGRDLAFVRAAAAKAGLPIVAGTGFYSQPYYEKDVPGMSEAQMVRALVRMADEEQAGAFGEIGSWDEMTADERRVFRAIGKAHVETGLPIITHTGIPGKAAIEQLNILEDAGVDPTRVVIGHLGNLVDNTLYVHKYLARRGAYIGFDRQGGNGDAQQVPLVMGLIDAGFADQLLFSADQFRGYGRTLTVFLPKLKAAGATDEVLRQIMQDNPRRFLAFTPKRARRS